MSHEELTNQLTLLLPLVDKVDRQVQNNKKKKHCASNNSHQPVYLLVVSIDLVLKARSDEAIAHTCSWCCCCIFRSARHRAIPGRSCPCFVVVPRQKGIVHRSISDLYLSVSIWGNGERSVEVAWGKSKDLIFISRIRLQYTRSEK